VGDLEGDVSRLQAQVDRTRTDYEAAAKVAGQLAVDRYVKAGADLDLFATQDVNLQARAAAFSRLISQHETDDADRYLALRQDLEALQKRLDSRLADQRQAVKDLDSLRESLFAELARLEVAEADLERMARELSAVLEFAATLRQLDLAGFEAQVFAPREAPLREDGPDPRRLTSAQATAAAPEHEDGYFIVPPIVDNVQP